MTFSQTQLTERHYLL